MMPFFAFAFLPEQASTQAGEVDRLFLYLIAVAGFFSVLIFSLIAVFAAKFRRRSESERPKAIHGNNFLEMLWTVIPLLITLTIFAWGTSLYFRNYRPPTNALEIFAVGKQWMWKLQHPNGVREINELHIPVNYPVKLTLTSEDVIHSFYIPVFRIKMDAVPGRYTHTWFQADKTGDFRFLCAEFCGTDHSRMLGWLHVMAQGDYRRWLEERGEAVELPGAALTSAAKPPTVAEGEKLFKKFRCFTCHNADSGALGPDLNRLFGKTVTLSGGRNQTVDEAYIHESIMRPNAKIVEGYAALMPTYEKLLTEQDTFAIIAYLKSLAENGTAENATDTAAALAEGN